MVVSTFQVVIRIIVAPVDKCFSHDATQQMRTLLPVLLIYSSWSTSVMVSTLKNQPSMTSQCPGDNIQTLYTNTRPPGPLIPLHKVLLCIKHPLKSNPSTHHAETHFFFLLLSSLPFSLSCIHELCIFKAEVRSQLCHGTNGQNSSLASLFISWIPVTFIEYFWNFYVTLFSHFFFLCG